MVWVARTPKKTKNTPSSVPLPDFDLYKTQKGTLYISGHKKKLQDLPEKDVVSFL